jgi:flagellar biogenesis protein FliO
MQQIFMGKSYKTSKHTSKLYILYQNAHYNLLIKLFLLIFLFVFVNFLVMRLA